MARFQITIATTGSAPAEHGIAETHIFRDRNAFFAISPMRRSGVFLMNRIATMSRMSTDTSPYERELNRREPGASADDIVMRARPNLRRPCRLHKAVAETPYE